MILYSPNKQRETLNNKEMIGAVEYGGVRIKGEAEVCRTYPPAQVRHDLARPDLR
jgi:hypothetical protein